MKKAALIILCAAFFISCGKKNEIPEGTVAETAQADPVKAGFTVINSRTMKWEFFDTAENKIRYSGAFEGTLKTNDETDFYPGGLMVSITGLDGKKRLIAPASLGEIAYSQNGRYLCFNMRLGTSPNTTAGILDTASNSVVFSFEIADKKPVPNARTFGIAMERVYRRLRISESGTYFSCSEFEAGKGYTCVYGFSDKKKIKEIEAAELGAFLGDELFYVNLGVSPPALMKAVYPFNKAESIGGIDGRIIDAESSGSRLFITTSDYIYIYEEEKGLIKAVDFGKIGKDFEIFEVVSSNLSVNEKGTYLFLTVKRYLKGEYSWRIYAGKF